VGVTQIAPYQPRYNLLDRKRFDMSATLEDVPENYLIDGVLHRSVTLIYGQTMAGKSTIAASIAVALATGKTEWAGRAVGPSAHGPVVIVCGDPDSRYEYQERLYKVRDEFTSPDHYVELLAPFRPTRPEGWHQIRAVVAEVGAKVVIIDNLSQFVAGSLSDDDLVKQFFTEVDEFARQGIAVLVLAHVSDKKGVDGNPARLPMGSSLIRFGPRWWALAWKGGGKVRLEFDGNGGGGWWLDMSEPDGIPRFDVLGSTSTEELKEGRANRARQRAARTLDDRSDVGGWVVANCQGMNREQTAEKIAAQFPDITVSTAKAGLSKGWYGGVKNTGPRNASRWERVAKDDGTTGG
jgi:hypothetical protein